MLSINRSIEIAAPPARVFDHLADPQSLLEIWGSLEKVEHPTRDADGRHAFDWTYRMAGVRFRGHCDTVDLVRGERRVDHNTGGIPSTFRWAFAPSGAGTRVTLDVDYDIPAVIGLLAGPVLRVVNEHEAEGLLQNLKLRMETGRAPLARAAVQA